MPMDSGSIALHVVVDRNLDVVALDYLSVT